jgi:two-component system LytT family response regulator
VTVPLKILVVDDEPEARELLNYILREQEGIEVVGMAGNVDQALKLLKEMHPDLVFLDIQMPGKDGFQFINAVRNSSYDPGIIFVTAFDSYAIQAIRNSVFDYIMKPVRQEEILHAIERFRGSMVKARKQDLNGLIEALTEGNHPRIKLNTRSGYVLIHPPDVVYCQADGNYTHIQLANGRREVTTQNLGSIEDKLQTGSFFRISRSYLVNLNFLARVERKSCLCVLEYQGDTYSIKVPSQKIRLLESNFR